MATSMINPEFLTDKDQLLRSLRVEIRALKAKIREANETIIGLQAELDRRLDELWRLDKVNTKQRQRLQAAGIEVSIDELLGAEEEVVDVEG